MKNKLINDLSENKFIEIKNDLIDLGYNEKHINIIIESYIDYLKKYFMED